MKKLTIIAILSFILVSNNLYAKKAPIWTDSKGLSLRGYDTVEYFQSGKALKGSKKFELSWQGAKWRFISAKNLEKFKSNKNKYAPQYGGYCSSAVAGGYTAPTDPHSFKIVNGKLYLNYNKSVHRAWLKNIKRNIEKADKNWPGVLDN